jgi:hypothetical protein
MAPGVIMRGIEGDFILINIHGSICYRTAPGGIEGAFIFINILLLVWF